MFKTVALLASLVGASAFAPVSQRPMTSSLKMAFENELGAQPPLGFWDPLGFLDNADQEEFDNLRFAELKHGRVCMLGVVGQLVASVYRFPGDIDLEGTSFASLPVGQAGFFSIPALGLLQIILSVGWWELKGWKQVEGSTPGDFGIPYLKQYNTPEKQERIRAVELNNGRAAQMGLLAMLVHEGIDGRPFIFFP